MDNSRSNHSYPSKLSKLSVLSGVKMCILHNCFHIENLLVQLNCYGLAEAGNLLDNVVIGILKPLVKGDGATVVGVHRLEVLLALLEPLLQK